MHGQVRMRLEGGQAVAPPWDAGPEEQAGKVQGAKEAGARVVGGSGSALLKRGAQY